MSKICIDKRNCVHCGACATVYSTDALAPEPTHWTLFYNENNCTSCHVCIDTCPLRSIKEI